MSQFKIHDHNSASADARPLLDKAVQAYGRVPNLIGVLAEAPIAAEAYMTLSSLLMRSSFTPVERHVVWFAVNYENNCDYCMAAHTAMAHGEKIAPEVIEAARSGKPYADPRLEQLRTFTLAMLRERGWVSEEVVEQFLEAGFTRQHILEIVVILAHKTLSNYTNHLATTPVDAAFSRFAWTKPEQGLQAAS